MILAAAVLSAAVSAPAARVLAVRTGPAPEGASLTVLTAGDPGIVSVHREGDEVLVELGATAPSDLPSPATTAPLQALRLERTAKGVTLHVRVPQDVSYQVQRQGTALTVLFGAAAPQAQPTPAPADVAELYRRILPSSATDSDSSGDEAGRQLAAPANDSALKPDDGADGWGIGALRLRPSISGTYVDAETALEGPTPVRDKYYQIQPRVGAELPLATGRLTGSYEARLRRGTRFDQVRETSHLADAALELPFGARMTLRGSGHYSQGILEANEVDPGGEYFFRLGRFTRRAAAAGLRMETGSRLDLDFSAGLNRVSVGPESGFFDYEIQNAGAAFGYDLGAEVRAALGYSYERVLSSERPIARATAHYAYFSLRGEVLPLLMAELQIGYRNERSPGAAASGTRYGGVAGSLHLTKDFTRGTRFEIVGSRSTPPSAFEQNAFYVASAVEAELGLQLPLSFSARGGAGYHWNDYKTVAAGLGAPRKDRIFGWSAGLGRPITRWAFVRADYRRDRRDSNLDVFDITTEALTVQLGIGLFAAPDQRR
jgi:hypothetical protein